MGVRFFGNRALVRYLVGFDYEMLELGSDDLVLGSKLYLWSPTITLHVLLNSVVEAVMTCLDSLRLPSCARTLVLTQDSQKHDKPLKSWSWSFGPIFPWKDTVVLIFLGL
ncbi:hypothetical protein M9H77_13433 [Catharanthus roseus]|uniref:Uncharacterized protein n=1 Tax=Catharanthus roseus TaxID=4058 RepID=A0ACC0BK36_CATRO|nr:hypothetical protein M9H77_13433 [Catharanthus roseus]